MILEVADIRIDPARQAEFDDAVVRGLTTVVSGAQGFRGYKVNKSLESPGRVLLMIYWDTLEDHTVGFRGGPLFAQWRAIGGPFFAQPPQVHDRPGGGRDPAATDALKGATDLFNIVTRHLRYRSKGFLFSI